jgi:dienelactone hydrolase
MKWSIFTRILKILLLVAVLVATVVLSISFKDYTDYFRSRHGVLAEVIEKKDTARGKYWITLRNSDGFRVDCGLLVPAQNPIPCPIKDAASPPHRGRLSGGHRSKCGPENPISKRYPAIILLGGKATGKYAIDYTLGINNVIILALDYPYEPRDSYNFWTITQDIPAVRQALIDMVPAAVLAVDYLFRRDDVDTTKLVILGYSFGAPFVPVIVANDRRAAVAAMVYGGGELHSMIRYNVARYKGPVLGEFVGFLGGALLLRPMEPMRFADKISPIPLIMINGKNDEQIPRHNTETFYNAAREPKKIVWLQSKHVNPNNPELTRYIIATLKEELRRLKIME